MPLSNSVKAGLELIQKDSSKILGLTVGKHDITEPGQYVPRAGKILPTLHTPLCKLAHLWWACVDVRDHNNKKGKRKKKKTNR